MKNLSLTEDQRITGKKAQSLSNERFKNPVIYIYMSAIAGQTAGSNGLTFFEETQGYWVPEG